MKIPYWYEEENEDATYFDYKCDVRFPSHEGNMNGEVIVWNLNDK